MRSRRIPITEEIIASIAGLIDDAQVNPKREPSYSDLSFYVNQVSLSDVDPKSTGRSFGKAKRIRSVLYWALENNVEAEEKLIYTIISNVRAVGGFRDNSNNFTGNQAIENLRGALKTEGFILTLNGEIHPSILENLYGREITEALKSYIRRAHRGAEDAALLAGTGKDLIEATAAHILQERTGSYPTQANFPTLLGQAFISLGLGTEKTVQQKMSRL